MKGEEGRNEALTSELGCCQNMSSKASIVAMGMKASSNDERGCFKIRKAAHAKTSNIEFEGARIIYYTLI